MFHSFLAKVNLAWIKKEDRHLEWNIYIRNKSRNRLFLFHTKREAKDIRSQILQRYNWFPGEIELFVNSPKGTTEELVKLNGKLIDGIKIIVTHIHQ